MTKTISFLWDISQLVIGTVVEETDDLYRLKNPALIAPRSVQPGQFQIDLLPLEVQTIEPHAILLRNLLEKPIEMVMTFHKNRILVDNLPIKDTIIQLYTNAPFNKQHDVAEDIKLY